MRDINFHGENRCSIASISKYIIRDILQRILSKSSMVIATAERPYYEVKVAINSISNIKRNVDRLKVSDDLFSLSFIYDVTEENEKFIEAFIDIWFEYEQPVFHFFISNHPLEIYVSWFNDKNRFIYYVDEIVDISPCYVLYKAIEEQVMWIEKSKSLSFEEIIDTK